MRRFYTLILAVLVEMIVITSIIGCSYEPVNKSGSSEPDDSVTRIVVTTFPIYDWVVNIIGNDHLSAYDITVLCDNGQNMCDYQLTSSDIKKISESDLFIYIGGKSDKNIESVLSSSDEEINSLNLMKTLGYENLYKVDSDEMGIEYDEHIWLSLKKTMRCVSYISAELAEINNNEAVFDYSQNTSAYIAKLAKLDKEFEDSISKIPSDDRVILFGDEFPFIYLAKDYNLTYYSAFDERSKNTEADLETIYSLADTINELNLSNVFVLKDSDGKLAETIIDNTKKKDAYILTLNPMQSYNKVIDSDISYLNIMQDNLDTLTKALGGIKKDEKWNF